MIETSQDIFYVILSFCLFWLTFFICCALYYLIKMLKQTNEAVTEMRSVVDRVTSLFSIFKSELVQDGLKKLMALLKNKRRKSKVEESDDESQE